MDLNLVIAAAQLVSLPVLAAIVGAIISVVRPPGPRFVAGVQHFAAGVVLAALVGEIMPELAREHHLVWPVVGFVLGAVLVLALGRRHDEGPGGGGLTGARPADCLLYTSRHRWACRSGNS